MKKLCVLGLIVLLSSCNYNQSKVNKGSPEGPPLTKPVPAENITFKMVFDTVLKDSCVSAWLLLLVQLQLM